MTLEALLDGGYAVALVATMWATALGLGMSVGSGALLGSLRDRRLVTRIAVLDVVVVPLVMLACVTVMVPARDQANGLLLVAFASAGPLGIKLAQVAGGDMAFAIGSVIVLEAANALVVPAWTAVLIPTGSVGVVVDIVRTLALLIILPLALGMGVRRWRRGLVPAAVSMLRRASDIGLVVVVVLALLRYLPEVSTMLLGAPGLAAVITVVAALVGGWALGGPARTTRISASLVTGVRANTVALAIAVSAFAATPDTEAAVLVFGIVSVVLPSVLAVAIGSRAGAGAPATPAAVTDPWVGP